MDRVTLVVPVYNDWISFRRLLSELDRAAAALPFQIFVRAVNDGSDEDAIQALGDLSGLERLLGCEIVHLSVNVGHQRAIAIGLCVTDQEGGYDALLIMDADGEDPPSAIAALTQGIGAGKDFCIVAQRRKRVETLKFKFFYFLYKVFFQLVTGKTIGFGNFCILSAGYVSRLVMVSDLWNNLPAAVLRSRLPIKTVTIDRGSRYAGKSKMNFTSLVVHGFSGISVYADTIFVRLLILASALIVVSVVSFFVLLTLRLFVPAHATPGWATTIIFGLSIIILQLVVTALSSLLMLLNNRVQRLVIPKLDYVPYVRSRQMLFGREFDRTV